MFDTMNNTKAEYITLNGRQEALVFTTAALQEVQDKYGSLTEMTEAFSGPSIEEWDHDDPDLVKKKMMAQQEAAKKSLEIVWWLIVLLANQGRMLESIHAELLTEKMVSLYMMPSDMENMMNAAMIAIGKGMGTYHAQSDGPIDPILEEVQKNVEGAGN